MITRYILVGMHDGGGDGRLPRPLRREEHRRLARLQARRVPVQGLGGQGRHPGSRGRRGPGRPRHEGRLQGLRPRARMEGRPQGKQRRDVRRRGDGAGDVLHRPRDAGARRRRARGRPEPEDVGGLALRARRADGEGREAGRGVEPGAAREEGPPRRALAERHEDRGVRAGQPRARPLIADSKFKEWPRYGKQGQGHIVLQHHGDPAWFRNVRITGTPVKAAR